MTGTEPGGGGIGSSRAWTDDEEAALDRYRQGHVIDDIPIVFVDGNATDGPAMWDGDREQLAQVGSTTVVAERPPRLRRAMVISQACDLMKTRFPWATVVPVYEASQSLNADQQRAASSGAMQHVVHLTASWAHSGFWVADLRLEIAVDKSVLLARQPLEAFESEVEYAELALQLAHQRARPAVPVPCMKAVVEPMFTEIHRRKREGRDLLQGVREVRVQFNDPVAPTIVTLHVVVEDESADHLQEWSSVIDELRESAMQASISIVGPEVNTLWDMSAMDYLLSCPVEDRGSS